MGVRSLGGEDPWRRTWQPTPVFLSGEPHGQRNLAATVHRITKSRTRVKRLSTHLCPTVCKVDNRQGLTV